MGVVPHHFSSLRLLLVEEDVNVGIISVFMKGNWTTLRKVESALYNHPTFYNNPAKFIFSALPARTNFQKCGNSLVEF